MNSKLRNITNYIGKVEARFKAQHLDLENKIEETIGIQLRYAESQNNSEMKNYIESRMSKMKEEYDETKVKHEDLDQLKHELQE